MDEVAKHKHGEAFALMWYACPCGHRERIWNSRDGVTPFGALCTSCSKPTLQHVDWQADEYAPAHVPTKGQRFWRDGTVDEAIAIIERRIERFSAQGHPVPADVAQRLMADAEAQEGEWRKGWPTMETAL